MLAIRDSVAGDWTGAAPVRISRIPRSNEVTMTMMTHSQHLPVGYAETKRRLEGTGVMEDDSQTSPSAHPAENESDVVQTEPILAIIGVVCSFMV
ncbi:hypothetical protein ACKWRH_05960 [Bradyrhizobium sp. Pa8]|uniref:hypothetical protein n=1 Tax=Bradyrhizobium sp. Pa8 TaxID=3386552 RepID=UPI00403FC06F